MEHDNAAGIRYCNCADPENCTTPIPGYACRPRRPPSPAQTPKEGLAERLSAAAADLYQRGVIDDNGAALSEDEVKKMRALLGEAAAALTPMALSDFVHASPAEREHICADLPDAAIARQKAALPPAPNEKRRDVDSTVLRSEQGAEQYLHGWIPCSERLPEMDQRVLAGNAGGQQVAALTCEPHTNGKYWHVVGPHRIWFDNVTHWMPLPPPPAVVPGQAAASSKT